MRFLLLFLLCAAGAASPAFAQIPATADGGRINREWSTQAHTPRDTAPATAASTTASPDVRAPAGANKMYLTLRGIRFDGVTVYTVAELDALTAPLLNRDITLADIYKLAADMTVRYRNDGYILSRVFVPPQTIDGGMVTLQAAEGFIDKITVPDLPARQSKIILRHAQHLSGTRPLRAVELERVLLLVNDLPGVSLRAVLSPSAHTPGAADLALVLLEKRFDAYVRLDNRGSRYLGPVQAQTLLRLNNPTGRFDAIETHIVTAPEGWPSRELDYLRLGWQTPLGTQGTRLDISASHTHTRPGHRLAAQDVEGEAYALRLALSHPVVRTRQYNLYTTLSLDYLDSVRTDNLGLGRTEDRMRVARLTADGDFSDRFYGLNTALLSVSHGLDILNMKGKASLNPTRARGEPEFFKANIALSRLQPLPYGFDIWLGAEGQKSAHTLLASEEFGVGGAAFGSGYDSSEITGEDGVAARAELRFNPRPVRMDTRMQPYVFYDIGKVWDADNTNPPDRARSLASTGTGIRLNWGESLSGQIEAALPLTRRVAAESDKNMRIFGAISARF